MTTGDLCPVCNATGDDPCLTKSGGRAKKPHAQRKIAKTLEIVRETAKQRFDRLKAERIARDQRRRDDNSSDMVPGVRANHPETRGVRERRRANGMRKSVHRGAVKRARRNRQNEEIRAFWQPKDDNAPV